MALRVKKRSLLGSYQITSYLNVYKSPLSSMVKSSDFVLGNANLYLCVSNAGTTNALKRRQLSA